MWSEDYCGHSRKLRVKKHPTLRSGGCINKMYEKNYYSAYFRHYAVMGLLLNLSPSSSPPAWCIVVLAAMRQWLLLCSPIRLL